MIFLHDGIIVATWNMYLKISMPLWNRVWGGRHLFLEVDLVS